MLNVGNCMAVHTAEPLAVAPGFIPAVCTGFLKTYSLWMNTLLSLDIVGNALDHPKAICLTLSEECVGGGGCLLVPGCLAQNKHTDTVLIKSLLGPFALASYWLTLTY